MSGVNHGSQEELMNADRQPTMSEEKNKVKIDPSQLIKHFHKSMVGITLIGLGLIALQLGNQSLIPFALGSLLVWLNMTLLAKGLGGVLNGEKSLAFLLLFKFVFLLGGVYVLAQIFPQQTIAVILGCSTWVLALMSLSSKINVLSQASVVCLLILCSTQGGYAQVSEAEMLTGEVHVRTIKVPGSSMPKLIAEGIIKAAPESLWAVIADCENFKKNMKNIKHSKHLGFKNGLKRCELVVDLPFPLGDLRSVVDVKLKKNNGKYYRSWSLVEGDYDKNEGEWYLETRADGYTFLRYTVHVEPKISVPNYVLGMVQESKIPGVFKGFTKLMKKRGLLLP
ncbi:MAG: hypothetical protein CMH49_06390 [Myxococcales bacterium]|nr:hypothetical protein [Myxococcales bacterium]